MNKLLIILVIVGVVLIPTPAYAPIPIQGISTVTLKPVRKLKKPVVIVQKPVVKKAVAKKPIEVQKIILTHKKPAMVVVHKSVSIQKPALVQKAVEPASIHGMATAYYNGKDRMNGESGVTTSGYDLDNGILFKGYRILASDNSIPFGTLVKLSFEDGSSITGVVLDRGGMITENRFDIVMRTKEECMDFGEKLIKYKIIGKVEL